ncbi:MAG: hypothetical protein GY835_03770 [bacterium]|nr:hypothetical protein [bacterium]
MRQHLIPALFIISLLIAPPAFAANLYVYSDGSGAYATIQDAVDAAGNGDTIWLAEGLYTGPGNRDVEIFKTLTIRGDGIPELCVIDCGGDAADPHRGFILESNTWTLQDLTITGGRSDDGGAIWVTEGTVNIEACLFHDNAVTDDGGAIYCEELSTVNLSQCRFANNRANDVGGCVYADTESDVALSHCTLADNSAASGSAIYLDGDASCDILCSIIAYGHGGAPCSEYISPNYTANYTDIYLNEGGDWVEGVYALGGINGNLRLSPLLCDPLAPVPNLGLSANSPCDGVGPYGFIGYTAPNPAWPNPVYGLRADGTGMYPDIQEAIDAAPTGTEICLENGVYSGTGNREIEFTGDAVTLCSRSEVPDSCILRNPGYSTLVLGGDIGDDTIVLGLGFSNDNSTYVHGSAVLATGSAGARFVNCRFEDLMIDEPGGAIMIDATSADPATIALDGCVFNSVRSYGYGGAIMATGWDGDIRNCTFINCRAYGPGRNGGAINTTDYTGLQIQNTLFDQCGTHEGGGGALHLTYSPTAQADIINCDFIGCTSAENGGGAYLRNAGAVSFSECLFDRCVTDNHGGGIYVRGSEANQTLSLEGCTFDGYNDGVTPVAESGGGIFASTIESITLTDTAFTRCAVTERGGGAYLSRSAATVTDCVFQGNKAQHAPAAYCNILDLHMVDCEFDANSGEEIGAMALSSCDGAVSGCRFTENSGTAGAAIYCAWNEVEAHIDVDHCVFLNNLSSTSFESGITTVFNSSIAFNSCTWHGNTMGVEQETTGQIRIFQQADVSLNYCIISGGVNASAVSLHGPAACIINCCDLYGNDLGDWTEDIAEQFAYEGNLSVAPLFCNGPAGIISLNADSPCLADNNICGATIGAVGQGCSGGVGIADEVPVVTTPALQHNYPNPFNPTTTIAYDLPRACAVSLRILDVEGRMIATLRSGRTEAAGSHAVVWQGRDDAGNALPSGFYFAELKADGVETTQRMLLLK